METKDAEQIDDVCLWQDGYKSRFYKAKFNVDCKFIDIHRRRMAAAYFEGLCWMLKYYYTVTKWFTQLLLLWWSSNSMIHYSRVVRVGHGFIRIITHRLYRILIKSAIFESISISKRIHFVRWNKWCVCFHQKIAEICRLLGKVWWSIRIHQLSIIIRLTLRYVFMTVADLVNYFYYIRSIWMVKDMNGKLFCCYRLSMNSMYSMHWRVSITCLTMTKSVATFSATIKYFSVHAIISIHWSIQPFIPISINIICRWSIGCPTENRLQLVFIDQNNVLSKKRWAIFD